MPRITSRTDDAQLMALIQLDRTDAFAALYDRHAPSVYRHAYRYVRNGALAEDVTQETFVRAWRSRDQFSDARGSARGWLLAIAGHRALDSLRHRSCRDEALDATFDVPGPDDTGAEVLRRERADAVATALLELPTDQRTVIELAYDNGLSQTEIARRLGVPLGTVKGRARLGLRRLRVELATTAAAA